MNDIKKKKRPIAIGDKLRRLFKNPIMYTTDDLISLTGGKKTSVQHALSIMQNMYYCGPHGRVTLYKVKGRDSKMRWCSKEALSRNRYYEKAK